MCYCNNGNRPSWSQSVYNWAIAMFAFTASIYNWIKLHDYLLQDVFRCSIAHILCHSQANHTYCSLYMNSIWHIWADRALHSKEKINRRRKRNCTVYLQVVLHTIFDLIVADSWFLFFTAQSSICDRLADMYILCIWRWLCCNWKNNVANDVWNERDCGRFFTAEADASCKANANLWFWVHLLERRAVERRLPLNNLHDERTTTKKKLNSRIVCGKQLRLALMYLKINGLVICK